MMPIRKFLFVLMLGVIGLQVEGQVKSGKVTYKETADLVLPAQMQQMRANFPANTETNMVLFFKDKLSEYKADESIKAVATDDRQRFMRMSQSTANALVTFYNHKEGAKVSLLDGFGKEFLIEEPKKDMKWKVIATEQRDILGYTCMKAELKDTGALVTAWFTPQIQASFGPADYHGLPGLILAIAVEEGKVILAQSIDITAPVADIEPPKKGKKSTREEFDAMMIEKQKEMESMWRNNRGGGGRPGGGGGNRGGGGFGG